MSAAVARLVTAGHGPSTNREAILIANSNN